MDSRTRLVIGGMSTVAASIAVVCAVAMTTSAALADTAGSAVGSGPVVVPSSSASPTPTPTRSTAPSVTPEVAAPAAPETLPAPEPEDVAAPAPVGDPSAATQEQLAAEVSASGSWAPVYEWAEKRGWSQARIDVWIARLDAKIAESSDDETTGLVGPDSLTGDRVDPRLPADAGTTSERDRSGSSLGSKREQSRVPPN